MFLKFLAVDDQGDFLAFTDHPIFIDILALFDGIRAAVVDPVVDSFLLVVALHFSIEDIAQTATLAILNSYHPIRGSSGKSRLTLLLFLPSVLCTDCNTAHRHNRMCS